MVLLPLLAALQQSVYSSPPAGDTAGYWQQHVDYRIVATLDERAEELRATGTLAYVNQSPDTLREMYLHQHLNAFRPASVWSAADAREGRVRFQNLREPHFAYERFTAAPVVDGVTVRAEYPLAPDSTVVRLALPRPLAPGDTARLRFAWAARPSTLPRRQGRRGRHYDFAQWYPRVAVYDRGGWQQNPLHPAGEFYGEFGTYDVTLIVREDQVVGATGVPVAGDPGYARALRWGEVHLARDAYGPADTAASGRALPDGAGTGDTVPSGFKRVRFRAEGVHHFGWSASPHYIYEGGMYAGRVPIHVLYQPGDEPLWGDGQVVLRTARALQWLESIYGRYLYPQVTNLHRIEGGGTEFPMLMMNGSPSQGLILHELGHIYTHGILANNEWRAGWMDEGLTSYQTLWAQGLTPHERARSGAPAAGQRPPGYRGRAALPRAHELGQMEQFHLDFVGRAEPPGTVAHEFREFAIYNAMIYTRAERMFGALRDAIGDSAFVAFLRLYYDRWKLKHVDELAMLRAAEDASGRELDWFFRQWVHGTGLLDYALRGVESRQQGADWVTRARIVKTGDYWHPMPVGARTASGWTVARGDARRPDQWVEIRTAERPLEVRLDPHGVTEDWDRRNDVRTSFAVADSRVTNVVFDWPFLEQLERGRTVVALAPFAWYSGPGGATLGARMRSSYQGLVDRRELGLAVATRAPEDGIRSPGGEVASDGVDELARLQLWTELENPRLFGAARPLMGFRMGAWALDGLLKARLAKRWDMSRFLYARGPEAELMLELLGAAPLSYRWADPARWDDAAVVEVGGSWAHRPRGTAGATYRVSVGGGAMFGDPVRSTRLYPRAEVEVSRLWLSSGGAHATFLRGFAGYGEDAPRQRQIHASSLDPVESFGNHLVRPRDGILSHPDAHHVLPGGAGLIGYDARVTMPHVASVVAESYRRVLRFGARDRPALWVGGFGSAFTTFEGGAHPGSLGAGLKLRGPVFDRSLALRLDFPIYVKLPELAVGAHDVAPSEHARAFRFRWSVSVGDLW